MSWQLTILILIRSRRGLGGGFLEVALAGLLSRGFGRLGLVF
jgi:hypothetical protein